MPTSPCSRGPELLVNLAVNLAKDVLFVSVGFGVLAVQRAQVRRRELTEALTSGLGEPLGQLEDVVKALRRLVVPDAA